MARSERSASWRAMAVWTAEAKSARSWSLVMVAARRGIAILAPQLAYCTDNAAKFALAGAERLALGRTSCLDAAARPRWPLDEARALADPVHKPGRKGAKA